MLKSFAALAAVCAAGFYLGTADAGKKPCPGNSCHTATTATVPGTTTAATTATGTTTTTPPPATGASFGISEPVDVLFSSGQAAMLTDYVALGIRWVRTDFAWHYIQPTDSAHFQGFTGYGAANYDALTDAIVARGLEPLALLTYTPAWANGCTQGWASPYYCPTRPPTDLGVAGSPSFNAFVSATVARYRDRVHVWEIWNEPNAGYFWRETGQTPAQMAAHYTALLNGAYTAIHAADPTAVVLGGDMAPASNTATTMKPTDYLAAMYQNGAQMDGVSFHPYSWSGKCGSQEVDGWWWFMWRHTPSLRSIMDANGDAALDLWATEWAMQVPQFASEAALQNCMALDVADWKAQDRTAALLWFSDHENGEGFALSDASYPPVHKPRWLTFQQAIR